MTTSSYPNRVTSVGLYAFAQRYPKREILVDGKPYMDRYALRGYLPDGKSPASPDVNIYLHRFWAPDKARHLHNHPWPWAVSIVLCGGYTERREDRSLVEYHERYVRDVIAIGPDTFHSIDTLLSAPGDTWTLFVTSNKHGQWGFDVPPLGWVPHNVYEKMCNEGKFE